MTTEPEARVLDFAQLRVTALADTLRDLVDQIKLTNSHVARLTRDVGQVQADLNQTRFEMNERFGRVDQQLLELRNDVLLQANQILSAQQSGRQALSRIQDLLERDGTEPAQ